MASHVYSCWSDSGSKGPLRSKDNIVLGAKMKCVKSNKIIHEVA
jgi:hypothetical protein